MGRPRNDMPLHDRIVRSLRKNDEATEADLSRELLLPIAGVSIECAAMQVSGLIALKHRSGKRVWQLTERGK